MSVLIAMGVFVLSHVLIARTRLKAVLIARYGERAYLAAYSGLSVVLLIWVIGSVLVADRVFLWATPDWGYGFAAIVSLAGFILIGIGSLTPNPLSVSFSRTSFDPGRPGMIGWVRHPIIWGFTLWGIAHVPANGDWPSIVLFAGSVAFGAIGVYAVERRLQRRLGDLEWRRLTAGRGHVDRHSLFGALLGLVLWLLFLLLHPVLFNADPLAVLVSQHA